MTIRRLILIIFVYSVLCDRQQCNHLASDNSFYDLSPLSHICADAPSCGASSAACSISEYTLTTPLGFLNEQSWSEKYTNDGEGISLVYGGGEDCNGDEGNHKFIITLQCDETTEYKILAFESKCKKSQAIIKTKFACPLYTAIGLDAKSPEVQETTKDFGTSIYYEYLWIVVGFVIGMVLAACFAITIGAILAVIRVKARSEDIYDSLPVYEPVEI